MNFGSKEKTMTSGEVRDIQLYVRGDIRNDGWVSPWREEQERRRKEELGERKFVTAPQIASRQERKPILRPRTKSEPRTCELCTTVIRTNNKTGRCIHHSPGRAQKVKALCPRCETPIRAHNTFGICTECYYKFRRMIHQDPIKTCDECSTQLRSNNKTGKCTNHAISVHRKTENAKRREKHLAMKYITLKVAA